MHISNDWTSVERWYDFCFVFEYKVISLKLIGCTTSKPSKSGTDTDEHKKGGWKNFIHEIVNEWKKERKEKERREREEDRKRKKER